MTVAVTAPPGAAVEAPPVGGIGGSVIIELDGQGDCEVGLDPAWTVGDLIDAVYAVLRFDALTREAYTFTVCRDGGGAAGDDLCAEGKLTPDVYDFALVDVGIYGCRERIGVGVSRKHVAEVHLRAAGVELGQVEPALHHAVATRDRRIVQMMIDAEALSEHVAARCYMSAVTDANEDAIAFLAAEVGMVDTKEEGGRAPLHAAVRYNRPCVVKALLHAGADPNLTNSFGCAPLHLAARKGLADVAYMLLEAGAATDLRDSSDRAPLHVASREGHTDVVRHLVSAGADLSARNEYTRTPLHQAARKGYAKIVRVLLDGGADANAQDAHGRSPLYVAASEGHEEAARLLIDARAVVDAPTREGWTSLHGAALRGHVGIVKALLAAGADVEQRTTEGLTALRCAQDDGHAHVVRLLLEAGARRDEPQ